jgi:hypothetical protein
MKNLNFWLWFTLIFVMITTVIFAAIFWNNNIKRANIIKNQVTIIDSLKVIIKKDKDEDIKINYMEKTLIIKYGISVYEAHYYAIIYYDFSNKYNISWEIYPALIWIESRFHPVLTSNKGASGIAQLMEITAKYECEKLKIKYIKNNTLLNVIICQVIGFTYLSESINKNGFDDGIRSYIGGPSFIKGSNAVEEYINLIKEEYMTLHYMYVGISNGDTTFVIKGINNGK